MARIFSHARDATGTTWASWLTGKSGATYLIPSEPEFRLDFLTPLHRKGDEAYEHPTLHITLQPLPFMEYSLEAIEQAALFCSEGAVVVNVPDPARFALHKLLVYGERRGAFSAKSAKDLAQAAHLLTYLGEYRNGQLRAAQADLLSRGKGWRTRLKEGIAALERRYPESAALELLRAVGLPPGTRGRKPDTSAQPDRAPRTAVRRWAPS